MKFREWNEIAELVGITTIVVSLVDKRLVETGGFAHCGCSWFV